MEDRFEEVFAEIPVVREALGWIPLVTPTSQIVGVQAMLNVKFGRWKNFSPPAMDIALGYYGQTPAPVDPEVRKIAAQKTGKEPITCRPADMIKPRMDTLRKDLAEAGMPSDDEHCVIYAMFPQELTKYYQAKKEPKQSASAATAASAPAADKAPAATATAGSGRQLRLHVNGKQYDVGVEEL